MVHMAERCSRDTGSDSGGLGSRRVVALRTTSRPQPAAPAWAGGSDGVTGWDPEPSRAAAPASASALAEAVFPRAGDLPLDADGADAFGADPFAADPFERDAPGRDPFEPDAEAAAFLNAPRRPLGFYVAPFGTPPFGNPPSGGARSVFGGPLVAEPDERGAPGRPDWGPAYSAGA
jgi:hypothetical protein